MLKALGIAVLVWALLDMVWPTPPRRTIVVVPQAQCPSQPAGAEDDGDRKWPI